MVVFCKNVKYIIGKENVDVYLDNYGVDSLFVNIKKVKLFWVYDKIVFVSLNVKNLFVFFNGNNLEKIDLKLDKVKVNIIFEKSIESIFGSLKNVFDFNCFVDGRLNFEVDKLSKMYLGNN